MSRRFRAPLEMSMFDAADSEVSNVGNSGADQGAQGDGAGHSAQGSHDANPEGAQGGAAAGGEGGDNAAGEGAANAGGLGAAAGVGAPDPAQQLDAAGKPPGEAKKPDLVPVHALHESRMENKELKRQLAELQQQQLSPEERAAIRALREQQAAAATKKTEDDDPRPDFFKDPQGYVDWQARQTEKAVKALKESEERSTQQAQFQ